MASYIIEVLGKPTGKERPKYSGRTRAFYTPKKTKGYEQDVANAWVSRYTDKVLHGALIVEIAAYFELTKTEKKNKKRSRMMLMHEIPYTKMPDIDNIVKAVLDGLNGVAYDDDNQVVTVIASKYYSDESKTLVQITEY